MANIMTIETVSNFPFDLNAGIRILPNADRRIGIRPMYAIRCMACTIAHCIYTV
jgi:hypothetical protein